MPAFLRTMSATSGAAAAAADAGDLQRGFERHAAMNTSRSPAILGEAFSTSLDWDVYAHE